MCVFFVVVCFVVACLEPSQASCRDAQQHSRAHHRPGAASASNQHNPALPGSHGGEAHPQHEAATYSMIAGHTSEALDL